MPSAEEGLTAAEAARRLAVYGPNEAAPVHRLSAVVQLFHILTNPLVIILLVASAIAASLGQQVDALIIVTMVALGVAINFWQSYRSQQAAEQLRSSVIPTATVRRDGAWLQTPLRNVVPGDVFRLSAGDLVPADGRLLESRDLSVQQSMLTGESLPAEKEASATTPEGTADPNAPHLVFLGTSVVSGTGTALAIATGPKTMFGEIAVRLRTRAPEDEVPADGHELELRQHAQHGGRVHVPAIPADARLMAASATPQLRLVGDRGVSLRTRTRFDPALQRVHNGTDAVRVMSYRRKHGTKG